MVTTDQYRILLVDDQEAIRRGLRAFLGLERKWQVCGEAVNGRDAVEVASQLQPDLIIMDITMPEMDGIEATREIRKVLPEAQILMLSLQNSHKLISDSFQAGATGYMLKSDLGRELFHALETVAKRDRFLSPALLKRGPKMHSVGEKG
ncbi:MAG: response regulator [Terriglobia bacterium]